jgi:hypothetical protein
MLKFIARWFARRAYLWKLEVEGQNHHLHGNHGGATDACSGTRSIVNIGMSDDGSIYFAPSICQWVVRALNTVFYGERPLWLVPDPGGIIPALTYTERGLEAVPLLRNHHAGSSSSNVMENSGSFHHWKSTF